MTVVLASLGAVLATACDEPATLAVEDAPGPLTLGVGDDRQWGANGGLEQYSVEPVGAELVSLRLLAKRPQGKNVDTIETTRATITPLPHSTCTVSTPVCDSTCVAELALDGEGVCMLSVEARTDEGETVSGCWYQARWQWESADDAERARQETRNREMLRQLLERCADE
jgi:hypothetical protein